MYTDFLPLVQKPARYINSEGNSVHKDLETVRTTVCLFFPDTYEVGMSHLGLRILYDILNRRGDTACERVFSPWTDYEEQLRKSGRPLASLESNLPIREFDIVGVSLQYELSYTNILAGLDLAGIPLRSADRTHNHPVVVAGGPCAVNPEPLSDFIDVFFIGEAEEAIHEVIDLKQKHDDRQHFLDELAERDGFYVPSRGRTAVRRRFLRDLDSAPYPDRPLLPLMKPVHDRVTVEVARGCIRGCRFCQAGIIYRPFRERSPERVKDILRESLACTGYEELSLASLSSGDYSAIEPLIMELMDTYRDSRVSVSLPSLRVGTLTPPMIRAIAGTRKTGFTLAPEAGTERLRRVINKPVSDLDLIDAAETIFRSGWSVLKLYFMIGLPTETDEDLDGIIRLGRELLAAGRRSTKRDVQINISVSTFVPKSHTPFQWFGQAPIDEIKRRQAYLGQGLRGKGITVKPHHPETSLLEGVFARGDRSIGRVLEEAFRQGCRFDGWSESFDFAKWKAAFAACGLDPAAYANRTFGIDEPLPWDHIRTGVTKQFLVQEYRRAAAGEITENCRAECSHCGMGCKNGGSLLFGTAPASGSGGPGKRPAEVRTMQTPPAEITSRIRMRYTKTGRMSFLSHLDFMTLVHRSVVRAGVPIAFSQGFNPHPRIAFGPALSVGIESVSEYLDMETDALVDLPALTADLNKIMPRGISFLEARLVPRNAASLSGSIARYDYECLVPADQGAGLTARVNAFLAQKEIIVTREKGSRDIRPCLRTIAVKDRTLLITLEDKDQIKPRIQDVVSRCFDLAPEAAIQGEPPRSGAEGVPLTNATSRSLRGPLPAGAPGLPVEGFKIRRIALYYQLQGEWVSPLVV
jgi:radical SAM-linked protein